MKPRDAEQELREAGAQFLRCRGSHNIWKLKDGTLVSFSVKGTASDLSFEDVGRLRRALKGKDGFQQKHKTSDV